MRVLARLLWILLVVGCNEVTTPTTAPLTLVVGGWIGQIVPLEGAQVCETDTDNCEFTDANGDVTLQLPFDQETSYTVIKEGFASFLVPEVIPSEGTDYPLVLGSHGARAEWYTLLKSPYPPRDTGSIRIAMTPRLIGATFTLLNATGKAYYDDEEGNWRSDLTATTMRGRGGFVEVSPGEFEVELGGELLEGCVASVGWPVDINRMKVPVRVGYETFVHFSCAPPP